MFRNAAPWTLLHVFMAISLAAVGSFMLVVFGGMTPAWFAPDGAGERPLPTPAVRLREKLTLPVNLDKGIDHSTPLKDALEFLADRYDVSIIVDTRGFERIGVQQAEEQPAWLPRMTGVELQAVLRMLLAQIRGDDAHGTFVIRGSHIVITTTAHVDTGNWRLADFAPPLVNLACTGRPLGEILQTIGDQSGVNVILDERVLAKARKPLTIHGCELRVDDAARLVAHMAGLQAVFLDNVIYVTDAEQGQALHAEADARLAQRRKALRDLELPAGAEAKNP